MDFELLNFWIEKYNFTIINDNDDDINKGVKLYFRLKACNIDVMRSSKFILCTDKNKIIEFFGFDTTIEYDYLKQNNLYEYLCTSNKLSSRHITYRGFKGPHCKNREHEKFNTYLKKKFMTSSHINDDYSMISSHKRLWKNKALKFFDKEKLYNDYLDNTIILNKLFNISGELKIDFSDFRRFVSLYGILNLLNWDNNKLNDEFNKFIESSWNINLSIFNS
jgi:hypothetical protein